MYISIFTSFTILVQMFVIKMSTVTKNLSIQLFNDILENIWCVNTHHISHTLIGLTNQISNFHSTAWFLDLFPQ